MERTIIAPKVFVSRMIPGLDRLHGHCELDIWPEELPPSYAALSEHVRGIDGLLCMLTDRIDGALMDAAGSSLKVISQMAVGYDNIDVKAARQRKIASPRKQIVYGSLDRDHRRRTGGVDNHIASTETKPGCDPSGKNIWHDAGNIIRIARSKPFLQLGGNR